MEGEQGGWGLLGLGLVDEFELFAILKKAVDVDEAGRGCAWADRDVFASTNNEEGLVTLTREADGRYGCSGFIVCQIDLLEG